MFNFVSDSTKTALRQQGAFGVNQAPNSWTVFFDNNYVLIVP